MKKPLVFIICFIFVFETCSSSPTIEARADIVQPRLAACTLETRTLRINIGNDNSKRYSPTFVKINRCGGGCSRSLLDSCQAIVGMTKLYRVKVEKLKGKKFIPARDEMLSVEEHDACMCRRKLERQPSRQLMRMVEPPDEEALEKISLSSASDEELEKAPVLDFEQCELESWTYNFESVNDTIYYPPAVNIKRCSPSCERDYGICRLTKRIINYEVERNIIKGIHVFASAMSIPVEEHTSCECQCDIRPQDCRDGQRYNWFSCRCEN